MDKSDLLKIAAARILTKKIANISPSTLSAVRMFPQNEQVNVLREILGLSPSQGSGLLNRASAFAPNILNNLKEWASAASGKNFGALGGLFNTPLSFLLPGLVGSGTKQVLDIVNPNTNAMARDYANQLTRQLQPIANRF